MTFAVLAEKMEYFSRLEAMIFTSGIPSDGKDAGSASGDSKGNSKDTSDEFNKRIGLDTATAKVARKYGEALRAFEFSQKLRKELTPRGLARIVHGFAEPYPHISDVASLDSFKALYGMFEDYRQIKHDETDENTNRNNKRKTKAHPVVHVPTPEELAIIQKIERYERKYAQSEIDLICTSLQSNVSPALDYLQRQMYAEYHQRFLAANISLFQKHGLDRQEIDSILKTTLNITDSRVYPDYRPSPEQALMYQHILLDIAKNLKAADLAHRVKPVLAAIEKISKHDMSLLDSFYEILDQPIGSTGEDRGRTGRLVAEDGARVVAEDDEVLETIADKIASYNWLVNYRARVVTANEAGIISEIGTLALGHIPRADKTKKEYHNPEIEAFDCFMRNKVDPRNEHAGIYLPAADHWGNPLVLNQELRELRESPLDHVMRIVPCLAEYGIHAVAGSFDSVYRQMISQDGKKTLHGNGKAHPMTNTRYAKLDAMDYSRITLFVELVKLTKNFGINISKFAELEDVWYNFYMENPCLTQFLGKDLPELKDLIHSDLDPETKAKLVMSYFYDKRVNGRVNLPDEYTPEGIERYVPVSEHDMTEFNDFLLLMGSLEWNVLDNDGIVPRLVAQSADILQTGLNIRQEVIQFIIGAIRNELPRLLDNVAAYAPVMRTMREGLLKAKADGYQYVAVSMLDHIRREVEAGTITEPYAVELVRRLPNQVGRRFKLDKSERRLLHTAYSSDDMAALCKLLIKNDNERMAIADLIRRDIGILPHTKNFPLGRIYHTIDIRTGEDDLPTPVMLRMLATVLLSRNLQHAENASRYFSGATPREMREYAHKYHVTPPQVYRMIEKDIKKFDEIMGIAQMPKRKAQQAEKIAIRILDKLRKVYFPNGRITPQNEALDDVLEGIAHDFVSPVDFASLAFMVQHDAVWDITGYENGYLESCAFKNCPNKRSHGGTLYGIEDEIGLLHVVPFTRGKVKKGVVGEAEILSPVGAAISVNCDAKDGSSWLAVDTFEGGSLLDRVRPLLWQAYVMQSLYEMARDMEHDYMIVNTKLVTPNRKPSEFAYFADNLGLEPRKVQLSMRGPRKMRQYGFRRHLLDMFSPNGRRGFNFPYGAVTGRVVDLSREYNFVDQVGLHYVGRAQQQEQLVRGYQVPRQLLESLMTGA